MIGLRNFLTEQDIRDLVRAGQRELALDSSTLLTDAARELTRRLGLKLVAREPPPGGTGGNAGAAPGGSRRSLKRRILGGEQVLGTFIQVPHPVVTEFVGRLGFDFLVIDGEHSALGPADLLGMLQAADHAGAPTLVRVAGNTAEHIAAALDAGAAGVIVPRVNGADEAARVVQRSLYPPDGARGLGPGRAAGYGTTIGSYRQSANQETVVSVQVETREAVDNLDAILATPGVDLIFLGPGDLSSHLQLAGGMTDPQLEEILAVTIDRTLRAGRRAGIFAPDPASARRWFQRGASLVVIGSDLAFLAQGASAARRDSTPVASR